jgi:hypothetical protein
MSKESVKRSLILLAALLAAVLASVPAGAQTALVVGSVRDRHGAAVDDAEIVGYAADGSRLAVATTGDDGTFALAAGGIARISVACRFCARAVVAVVPGQPVVAIVRRYDALLDGAPSPDDLANLPYAHVESSIALRPFTLLQQSNGLYPGSQLSDRGVQPSDALLIDAGVPNYDVTFGASPYVTIPAKYEQSAAVASGSNAFLYGDRAGSGIVTLQPFGGDDADVALLGGDSIVRLQTGSDAARIAVGSYSNDLESRQRTDARLVLPLSAAQSISFNGGTSQGRSFGDPTSSYASNFSFANGVFDDAQPNVDVHAGYQVDRAGYDSNYDGFALSDVWSDAALTAGVRTRGPVQVYADLSNRLSTGIYQPDSFHFPRAAGTLSQNRIDVGVEASGTGYDVDAGIGYFGIGYTGGVDGTSNPLSGHLATPSLQIALLPESRWSVDLDATGSFTLQNLWQQLDVKNNYATLTYDRNSLYSATLSYSDQSRLQISAQAASQRVTGYANGIVTSSGLSVSWQIAPVLSLRAWTMHVDDATVPSGQTPYPPIGAPTVNALWLTYQNDANVRIDAIYRRDVLDRAPFQHLDADVSGPLANHLRWYAGVEDRERTTFLDAGLRFGQ